MKTTLYSINKQKRCGYEYVDFIILPKIHSIHSFFLHETSRKVSLNCCCDFLSQKFLLFFIEYLQFSIVLPLATHIVIIILFLGTLYVANWRQTLFNNKNRYNNLN